MSVLKAPVVPVYNTAAEAHDISINEGYLVALERIHDEIDEAASGGLQSITLKNALFAFVRMEGNEDPLDPQRFRPLYTEQQQKVVDHLIELGYAVECPGGNYNGKNVTVSWMTV